MAAWVAKGLGQGDELGHRVEGAVRPTKREGGEVGLVLDMARGEEEGEK